MRVAAGFLFFRVKVVGEDAVKGEGWGTRLSRTLRCSILTLTPANEKHTGYLLLKYRGYDEKDLSICHLQHECQLLNPNMHSLSIRGGEKN